jgi:hypothetical protein
MARLNPAMAQILRNNPKIWDYVFPHSITEAIVIKDIEGFTPAEKQAYVMIKELEAKTAQANYEIAKRVAKV